MLRKQVLYKFLITTALLPAASLPLQAGTLVDIDVVNRDSGRWLPEYRHHGLTWIPGEPGHRYAVRLANLTGERVLIVLSVDGVNAVTGETASPSQAGYVLSPWESAEIVGWRKSFADVAQFHFTDLPDSYAARTGRPDDVGVIGIAVFRERTHPVPYPSPLPPIARKNEDDRTRAAGAPANEAAADASTPAYASAARAQRIGTGHGAREWAPVGRTEFARASAPAQMTELRYHDGDTLVAFGIAPGAVRARPAWSEHEPRAFPNGFVADPPDW